MCCFSTLTNKVLYKLIAFHCVVEDVFCRYKSLNEDIFKTIISGFCYEKPCHCEVAALVIEGVKS